MATMAETNEPMTGPMTGERELAAWLRKVNLDLLPVLHELLRTRSVTRTAQSFNMTQPAVSRAWRQLRGALDDQILVSSGRNARLTDQAETLAGPAGPYAGRARPAPDARRSVRSGDRSRCIS